MFSRPTGRIESRQHLAEGVLVVSWGCSGGAQWPHRDHVLLIQLGLQGSPEVRKFWPIPLYTCGNVVDLPHVTKCAIGGQVGLGGEQDTPLGSPLYHGAKFRGLFPRKMILFFGHAEVLRAVCAPEVKFRVWYAIWRFQPHQGA